MLFTEPLRTWTGEAKKTILHGAATACRVATTRCKHQSRHTTLIANYPLTRLNWPNTSQFSPHSALYDATSTFHVDGKSGPFRNLFPFSHLLSVSSFIFLHSFCEPNESRTRKRRRRRRKLARQKSHPIPEQARQSVAQRVFQSRVSVSAARVKGITGRKGNGKRTRNQFILNNSSLVFDTNSLIFPTPVQQRLQIDNAEGGQGSAPKRQIIYNAVRTSASNRALGHPDDSPTHVSGTR